MLKLVKHPNLHVELGEQISVSDAMPVQRGRNTWSAAEYWTLFDVEHFLNQIAVLSVKSVTYTVAEDQTVTIDCDENFPLSFMEFLTTQRIYYGYSRSWPEQLYLTLESAKASKWLVS